MWLKHWARAHCCRCTSPINPRILWPFQKRHFARSSSSRAWRRTPPSVRALTPLKIRKSHGDVEPIQHVLRFRRHLLLDGSQTDIPIGKNCDRRGFGDSALAHGKIDRAHRLGTSIAHEGKTGGIALALEDFARHDLEVS